VSKPSLVIVLLEDARHKMLIYRYLKKRDKKLNADQIRVHVSPSGSGSAENWVQREFVREVGEYRRRQRTRGETALIVMIDADTHTVQHRLGQLEQALREGARPPVDTDTERIARLVPRRNIETWILCLSGHEVDEEIDYKREHHDWAELTRSAAETLFQWARSNAQLPNHCIESLRCGITELRRLDS
jgi:hypothetical protein